MKALLLAATVAVTLAVLPAANAADFPARRMPEKAPAYIPPQLYSWTGFYIGANGGGGFGRSALHFPGEMDRFDVAGGLIGGTVGFNYQLGSVVLGLEGDLDWSTINGSGACIVGTLSCQTKNDWLGTARGRIGYAFDQFLPYVTGGAAFGNLNAGMPAFGLIDATRTGWTLGAGIEYGFLPNWSAKLEYLYVDLGSVDCGAGCGGIVPAADRFSTSVFRAGINYRFW
jgi:outer membrane immunogenic protein